MRNNQPVTQRAHPLPADRTLVSVTDLKGRITYCNHAFVEASGYAEAELLGQPHNLVRHPDVPAEAFRDLWATVQAGRPWSGIVKNRRKNGDHYWVFANAAPMMSQGHIAGYLSVRAPATAEQVKEAEALYALLQADAARAQPRWALRDGALVRRGTWHAAWQRLRGARWHGLFTLQALTAAAALGAAAWSGSMWAAAGGLVLAALHTAWANRWAAAPLNEVVATARRLAAGDLAELPAVAAHGPAHDVQQALRQTALNLRTVIGDCRSEVQAVRAAVAEIAQGNRDLAQRTDTQAASLQATAASIGRIDGTVDATAHSAQDGAALAQQAAAVAEGSHEAVEKLAGAMGEIAESSRRIGEIVHLIESVAFQTNMLSLNAAVEAARAGEQGKGFAVVAGEVRQLAKRTANAVGDINRLIHESTERVSAGSEQTTEARNRMNHALDAVRNVSRLLEDIRGGANEQRQGIGSVNEAVQAMDGITQQNAAMVEQLAMASAQLDAQVEAIVQSMSLFRLQANDRTAAERDAVALRRTAKHAVDA